MKHKHIYIAVLTLFISLLITSGVEAGNSNEEEYLAFAEVMPAPIGGMSSITSKIKYPTMARKQQVEGKVYILAYVDENGGVAKYKVIKDIGAGCGDAAGKAIMECKFNPGKMKDTAVKVKLSLPIEFKLK